MTKSARIAIAFIAAGTLVATSLWIRQQIRIDSCLDQGGRWDYATSICDKA